MFTDITEGQSSSFNSCFDLVRSALVNLEQIFPINCALLTFFFSSLIWCPNESAALRTLQAEI